MLALPEEVDREFLFQALLARETLASTGVGDGIAIPHLRNPIVLHLPGRWCRCVSWKSRWISTRWMSSR